MMDCAPGFQPCQILCLEHQNTYLYVELVQLVPERQLCWVRPLALKTVKDNWAGTVYDLAANPMTVIDLRQGADLVWSARSFRAALDVEVVPVLAQLQAMADHSDRLAQQKLREFIQQVWQANPVDASAVDGSDGA